MTRRLEGLEGTSLVAQVEVDSLIEALPSSGRMLEIGTWHGVTAAEIARARPCARLVCVDPFVPGRSTDAGDEFRWRANARVNMELFVGTAREYLLRGYRQNPFDLAFVDGSHSYADALEDLRVASLMLAVDGLLVAHDYDRGGDLAVKRAVEEFCNENPFHMLGRVHQLALMGRD